jgi:hypothetical protein
LSQGIVAKLIHPTVVVNGRRLCLYLRPTTACSHPLFNLPGQEIPGGD